MMEKKRGQIWIETVIYTLIGLTIIGILISIITPRINEMKDRTIIKETISSLNDIDSQISNIVIMGPGNQREIFLTVRKGEYLIDAGNDKIIYVLKNTNLLYSEINESFKQGDIEIITTEEKGKYEIQLSLSYDYLSLTYENKEASTPHNILIENKGRLNNLTQINIKII